MVVNVLHEIDDKNQFVLELKRIAKTGGKIAIIEWEKKQMDIGPNIEERLNKIELIGLLESNGIEIITETTFANCFYCLAGVSK